MDPIELIHKYYTEDTPLCNLLLLHSKQVTHRALYIAKQHPEFHLDQDFISQAAMLHDVGIFMTDAPGIYCEGEAPYLMHGYLGAELMRKEGYEDIARVCERHTGTGLTARQVKELNLPIPVKDYLPETLEEQVICYADKFFSKSHPLRIRTVEETAQSLEKFGAEGVMKFRQWAKMFENQ